MLSDFWGAFLTCNLPQGAVLVLQFPFPLCSFSYFKDLISQQSQKHTRHLPTWISSAEVVYFAAYGCWIRLRRLNLIKRNDSLPLNGFGRVPCSPLLFGTSEPPGGAWARGGAGGPEVRVPGGGGAWRRSPRGVRAAIRSLRRPGTCWCAASCRTSCPDSAPSAPASP